MGRFKNLEERVARIEAELLINDDDEECDTRAVDAVDETKSKLYAENTELRIKLEAAETRVSKLKHVYNLFAQILRKSIDQFDPAEDLDILTSRCSTIIQRERQADRTSDLEAARRTLKTLGKDWTQCPSCEREDGLVVVDRTNNVMRPCTVCYGLGRINQVTLNAYYRAVNYSESYVKRGQPPPLTEDIMREQSKEGPPLPEPEPDECSHCGKLHGPEHDCLVKMLNCHHEWNFSFGQPSSCKKCYVLFSQLHLIQAKIHERNDNKALPNINIVGSSPMTEEQEPD